MKALANLMLAISIVGSVMLLTNWYLNLPIVYEEHLTHKCVKVFSPDPEHSCDNMPGKYLSKPVAPR